MEFRQLYPALAETLCLDGRASCSQNLESQSGRSENQPYGLTSRFVARPNLLKGSAPLGLKMKACKACPFCSYADTISDSFKEEWFVRCSKCGSLGPVGLTEEEAISKWDRAERSQIACCQGKGKQCGRCPMREWHIKAESEAPEALEVFDDTPKVSER